MRAGQKVVCIDDEGWMRPDLGKRPVVKGEVYCIREVEMFGGVMAISLAGYDPDHFYRACRFRPIVGSEVAELEAKARA